MTIRACARSSERMVRLRRDPRAACFGCGQGHAQLFERRFYPVGGASVLSERMLRVIERAGGPARVDSRVEEILVEDRAAVG